MNSSHETGVLVPLYGRRRREGLEDPVKDYAIVSKEDAEAVLAFRWNLSGGYAHSQELGYLHRLVLGLPRHRASRSDLCGDHINRDKLDNRRSNLRAVTHAENMRNRSPTVLPRKSRRATRQRYLAWVAANPGEGTRRDARRAGVSK